MITAIDKEAPMWVVEFNVAGRRFTHEVHVHPRRPKFRLRPRSFSWRPSQLRDARAA
jgi:hypothetical protein